MELCLLCLEINDDSLNGIKTDSIQWKELNIADIIEKHFWPLNASQSSSSICSSCWQIVKDFHEFYLRIEVAHTKCKLIKVEKAEIMEFQQTDLFIEQETQEDIIQRTILADDTNMSLEENTVDITKVQNEQYIDILASYESDSDISDDDKYQEDPNSSEHGFPESKCKKYDKFIAEHFKEMKCDLCQQPFIDFTDMKKHFTNKHNQRGYIFCCNRKFSERFHFVDHLHLHLNPNHFKCNHCGKNMSDRKTIKRHIMAEHLGHVYDECHQCDMCDISFNEEYLLTLHKSIHLPDAEKKFPCRDCAESYNSFYPLLQHLKDAHLIKFFKTCYVCGKSLIRRRDFESHINTHEGRPLAMIYCDICGLGLTTESGLKRHQKSQHPVDGKKDYQCPHCPKISPTLKAIRRHIKYMHLETFNDKCEICEKVFKRKALLKEHMAEHRGTPLYSCGWCPKTFYSNRNMHAHRRRIHPKECEERNLQKYAVDFQPIIANSTA